MNPHARSTARGRLVYEPWPLWEPASSPAQLSETPLPDRLRNSRLVTPLWEVAGHEALCRVPSVGRFLIRAGRQIEFERVAGVSDERLSAFLSGPIWACLQIQRGAVVLEAAAVRSRAGAVLMVGSSGSGKSALAAGLIQRGYQLLSDGYTAVRVDASGVPFAIPGAPRVRLWADAARALGLGGDPAGSGAGGRSYVAAQEAPTGDCEIGGLAFLNVAPAHGIRVELVRGAQRMKQVHLSEAIPGLASAFAGDARVFQAKAALSCINEAFEFTRPKSRKTFRSLRRAVEEQWPR